MIRLAAFAFAILLAACGSSPPPAPVAQQPKIDPAKEPWYPEVTAQLAALNAEASKLLTDGKIKEAGEVITRGQPLEARLLSAPAPTLAALEAAADLDDLYGRLLEHNLQFGWARQVFQKNVIRWKNWRPRTPDTERRLNEALAAVAECDRRMTQ